MKIGYARFSTEDQNPDLQIAHAKKLIEQGEHHDTVASSLNVSRRTFNIGLYR